MTDCYVFKAKFILCLMPSSCWYVQTQVGMLPNLHDKWRRLWMQLRSRIPVGCWSLVLSPLEGMANLKVRITHVDDLKTQKFCCNEDVISVLSIEIWFIFIFLIFSKGEEKKTGSQRSCQFLFLASQNWIKKFPLDGKIFEQLLESNYMCIAK